MRMNSKLKEAFDRIQPEEGLTENTKAYVCDRLRQRKQRTGIRALAAAAACLVLLAAGGSWLYFAPPAEISVDINPSVELSVNRFDRVISVQSWNEDGQELAESLDLKYADCQDAVEQILSAAQVSQLLEENGVLTISVIGPDGAQTEIILLEMEAHSAGHQNVYCYSAREEEVEAAHALGLSHGKYRAYLELKRLDPTVTPEQIRGMSMREIRDLLDPDGREQHGDGGCAVGGQDHSGDCQSGGHSGGHGGHHSGGHGGRHSGGRR